MAAKTYLDVDMLDIHQAPDGKSPLIATLFWGDELKAGRAGKGWTGIELGNATGYAKGEVRLRREALLSVYFIDVGQGDAAMIETPDGKRVLIDAGEEQFLARYLARKFGATGNVHFDAILISHGDADHFAGLPILVEAARHPRKPIVVTADRVLHNGLVKMQGKTGTATFGKTQDVDGRKYVLDLFEDPREVAKKLGNGPFKRWAKALDELEARNGKLEVKRACADRPNPLAGLSKETDFAILGPLTRAIDGVAALPFLGRNSASHTINGNSVVLKVTHGAWRFLFCGDLNEESEGGLLQQGEEALRAEIFKVPHHGSADFGDDFLAAVRPLVSVVSTGTTSARKEYLHPRANLVAALGAAARPVGKQRDAARPIVLITRLAGAFEYEGPAIRLKLDKEAQPRLEPNGHPIPDFDKPWFYAVTRENYGIVHVRCDKQRMLVLRRGFTGHTEAYAYRFENGRYCGDDVTG